MIGEMLCVFDQVVNFLVWFEVQVLQDLEYQILCDVLCGKIVLVVFVGMFLVLMGIWCEGMVGFEVGLLCGWLVVMGLMLVLVLVDDLFDVFLIFVVVWFQFQIGLILDGVVGLCIVVWLNGGLIEGSVVIFVVLEWMCWMYGCDLMVWQVWVNLFEYIVCILDGGQQVFEICVVIGKVDLEFEMFEFSEMMKYLVVNLCWNVLCLIMVKEYLLCLQVNCNVVSYIDVVDWVGNVIVCDWIDFCKYIFVNFFYWMWQKFSDDNVLGVVKFMFLNLWNIYLYDMLIKYLFNQIQCVYLYGCICVGCLLDLVNELL